MVPAVEGELNTAFRAASGKDRRGPQLCNVEVFGVLGVMAFADVLRAAPVAFGLLASWRRATGQRLLADAGAQVLAAVSAAGFTLLWREWLTQPGRVPWVGRWCFVNNYIRVFQAESFNDLWGQLSSMARSPTYAVRLLGLGHVVMTGDPRNVEHILKHNFDNYPKGPTFTGIMQDLLGEGIFNADGAQWLQQRKSASRLFTLNNFKEYMLQTFVRHANTLADLLDAPAVSGEAVNMFALLNCFTLDSIGEVGFGHNIDSLHHPENPVVRSFDAAQILIARRFTGRSMQWRIERALGLGEEAELRHHVQELDTYSRRIAHEAWQSHVTREETETSRRDFLSLFIRDMPNAQKSDSKLMPHDEEALRDVVMNFLIAGRDTTAQALSWTLFALAQHPSVSAKLREELVSTLGETAEPSFHGLQRLEYTQCVINEALRLYPSVPKNLKIAVRPDTLPDGTYVPAGCMVSHVPYMMGRMKSIWGEDAQEFRPERWLKKGLASTYEYPVFHAGPRECLGRRMANLEMKVCLAVLLRRYDLHLAMAPSEVKHMESVTLPVAVDMPIVVVARN